MVCLRPKCRQDAPTRVTIEHLFRATFVAVLTGMFFISGYFRRRARQVGDVIPRAREGKSRLLARLLVAAPLYLSMVAYAANPKWMAWSSFSLPTWLRWFGAATGLAMLPLLYWVMTSIGKNVSETYLTKESHQLVTAGPYRWVRHPLYTVAALGLVSLSLVAANWFMLAMASIAFVAIAVLVVPKEEAELVKKFGRDYRGYQRRTGRFAPRIVRLK